MPAKLIFFQNPYTGRPDAQFCPLVKTGCEGCFLPPGCQGENDPVMGFNLTFRYNPETTDWVFGEMQPCPSEMPLLAGGMHMRRFVGAMPHPPTSV